MSLVGTATAGAGPTNFDLNHVPHYIDLLGTNLAADAVLQVSVDGYGVICNLDAAGVDNMGVYGSYGTAAATRRRIYLANGRIPLEGECRITVTATTNDVTVYEDSLRYGNAYRSTQIQRILAGSPKDVFDFTYLGCINLAATDIVTINTQPDPLTGRGYVADNLRADQIAARYTTEYGFGASTMAVSNASIINNELGMISNVRILAAATLNVYTQKLVPLNPAV